MTPTTITLASGRVAKVPLFNYIVAQHYANTSSYIDTLMEQINGTQIYAPLFAGKKDLVFLDIGANIGLVSIYAADSCSRIVAIEPAPDTFEVLKVMTSNFPNIEPARVALAPIDGECEFYTNDLNTTASSTVNTYGTRITVPGMTLTSILRQNGLEHVDVCKVDAEGSEGESLNLGELILARMIVRSYYIETHNCPLTSWEHKLGTIVGNLSRLGYHKQTIDGMTLMALLP